MDNASQDRQATMERMLREMEWRGGQDNHGCGQCPWCYEYSPDGHKPSCEFALLFGLITFVNKRIMRFTPLTYKGYGYSFDRDVEVGDCSHCGAVLYTGRVSTMQPYREINGADHVCKEGNNGQDAISPAIQ